MKSKICIVGDVVTDVSLPQNGNEIKVRLGGIVHSSRMAWSMDEAYDVYFVTPNYLTKSVIDYHNNHGANRVVQIGEVNGAPYVFLIGSVKETGDQLYDFLLREEISIKYIEIETDFSEYDEMLITTGSFSHAEILNKVVDCKVHIDLSNDTAKIAEIGDFHFETIFISTSSELFKNRFENDFESFARLFQNKCNRLVLKENRGGSRIFEFETEEILQIPSITQPIAHSVGVGDAYNVCFILKYKQIGVKEAGFLSSWLASEYASTTYPDDLKRDVKSVLKLDIAQIITSGGCILPWEKRKEHSIYIAAPDFNYMDKSKIDLLFDSLTYHNFRPRRPIEENGQIKIEDSEKVRAKAFEQDIKLLNESKLLIAVYISDDPGTMIELGYAKSMGIPCLVFDPYNKADNCMLTQMPQLITSDLDEIISEVFHIISKFDE